MTEIIIGNSGFKYVETYKPGRSGSTIPDVRICVVKYLKTNETLFTIKGTEGQWQGRGTRATKTPDTTQAKKFLGLDNKYYYINVSRSKVDWGQVQPSGAVLRSNRTVLTVLAFYPIYKEVPEPKPIIKNISMTPKRIIEKVPEPKIPIKNIPMTPKLVVEDKEKKSWINNLIKQIQTLINQIISLLKS